MPQARACSASCRCTGNVCVPVSLSRVDNYNSSRSYRFGRMSRGADKPVTSTAYCIHVSAGSSSSLRRPKAMPKAKQGEPLRRFVATPVDETTTRHAQSRGHHHSPRHPHLPFAPRAAMHIDNAHDHSELTHTRKFTSTTFSSGTSYRPAEPGVPLPRSASPFVRYCGGAHSHNPSKTPPGTRASCSAQGHNGGCSTAVLDQ